MNGRPPPAAAARDEQGCWRDARGGAAAAAAAARQEGHAAAAFGGARVVSPTAELTSRLSTVAMQDEPAEVPAGDAVAMPVALANGHVLRARTRSVPGRSEEARPASLEALLRRGGDAAGPAFAAEAAPLFAVRMAACMHTYAFVGDAEGAARHVPVMDVGGIEAKTAALKDVRAFLSTIEGVAALSHDQYGLLVQMFAANVFRALPPRCNGADPLLAAGGEGDVPYNCYGGAGGPDDDDTEVFYEPAWPHMSLVYDIFIRLIDSPALNVAAARAFIDGPFVLRLLALFDVEDGREREAVKTAVHRVYGKFLNLRAAMRKSMRHVFYEFVYDDQLHTIGEMLEILGSIINGFAVPLREEHTVFLEKSLIPLHGHPRLPSYYAQLCLCIVQFSEKDPHLTPFIIRGLLRLWPQTNTTKEMMFLNEIEDLCHGAPPDALALIIEPLCARLARCITSEHFQVAERALHFFSNEPIIMCVAAQAATTLPLLLPPLLALASGRRERQHWNRNVQLLICNVLKLFMQVNPSIYERIAVAYDNDEVAAGRGEGLRRPDAAADGGGPATLLAHHHHHHHYRQQQHAARGLIDGPLPADGTSYGKAGLSPLHGSGPTSRRLEGDERALQWAALEEYAAAKRAAAAAAPPGGPCGWDRVREDGAALLGRAAADGQQSQPPRSSR